MSNKIEILFVVFFTIVVLNTSYAKENLNCFSIIAGKNATADNSVLIAHNEDDGGDNLFVYLNHLNYKKVKEKIKTLLNGADIPFIKKPNELFQIHINNVLFGDSCLNEYGVVIASNACASREDRPVLFKGGISKYLRVMIALKAKTSREAVKYAGELVEKYGYASSGRTYVIADSNEGWLLHIVNGKHWIAKRVPDNEVAVIANYYTIGRVNLKDNKNYLGSPDIISYAKKRGWFPKNESDIKFDFAKVYSSPNNFKSMVNILRQWRATNLLSDKKYKINERFPFSFIPRREIKITDLFEVLRDHYEDTDYDLTNNYKKGSPNNTKNRTICTESTRYSFVAVLNNKLPSVLKHLVWLALSRPDTNAYSPFYFSSVSIPSDYSGNFNKLKQNVIPKAYLTYSKLSRLVDESYKRRIKPVRKKWKNFEKFSIRQIKKKRKEFIYILKKNMLVGKKIINNFTQSLEYKRWFLASEFIDEFENKK